MANSQTAVAMQCCVCDDFEGYFATSSQFLLSSGAGMAGKSHGTPNGMKRSNSLRVRIIVGKATVSRHLGANCVGRHSFSFLVGFLPSPFHFAN